MDYDIREIRREEIPLLDSFLYKAIYVPPGKEAPPQSITQHPELRIYVEGFGKKDDICRVATAEGQVIGAAWTRIIHDYGHVSDDTPSLSISVLPQYRGLGIGRSLMEAILRALKEQGYEQVSLSVQKANFAVDLYLSVGFTVIQEKDDEYIMLCRL